MICGGLWYLDSPRGYNLVFYILVRGYNLVFYILVVGSDSNDKTSQGD